MRGKTIVVTGAFGVLGRAVTAEAAAQAVTAIGRLDVAVPRETGPGIAIAVDLTDADATSAAMRCVRDETGRIDALFNIAGGFAWQTVAEGDLKTWDQMFAMNLKTALVASK